MSYDPIVSLVAAGVFFLLAVVFGFLLYVAGFGNRYQRAEIIRKKVFAYLLLTVLSLIMSVGTLIFVVVMSGIN